MFKFDDGVFEIKPFERDKYLFSLMTMGEKYETTDYDLFLKHLRSKSLVMQGAGIACKINTKVD